MFASLATALGAWELRRDGNGFERSRNPIGHVWTIEHQVIRTLYVSLSLSAVVLLTAVNTALMSAEPPGLVF